MPEVEIYSTRACGYCTRAKRLFERKGVPVTEHDVGGDPERARAMVERSGGRRTVPQIFIGGEHVGGWEDLAALDASGGLDPLLGREPAAAGSD